MSKTPQPTTPRDDDELQRLRAFIRDVRQALTMNPYSAAGSSPEAAILSLKHALVRFDGAAPPLEPRTPDPSLMRLPPVDP